MKILEIRQMSDVEIKNRIATEEESLANLKFRLATNQLENPMKIRETRRSIAKLTTIFHERKLGITTKK